MTAPGKADREWPPRVWVHMDSLKNPKATYFVAKNEKFDGTEYLSTAEHQAILAQAVAAALQEAIQLCEDSTDKPSLLWNLLHMRDKATAERGGKV